MILSFDPSSPQYQIAIKRGGSILSTIPRDRIQTVTFEEKRKGNSELVASLRNDDGVMMNFAPIMKRGSSVEFHFGYFGNIRGPEPFITTGPPTGGKVLQFKAKGKKDGLSRKPRTRTWKNVKRSGVAAIIGIESGYSGSSLDVDDSKIVLDQITQTGVNNLKFMEDMAELEGFLFWIDGTGWHFKTPPVNDPPRFAMVKRAKTVIAPGMIQDYNIEKYSDRIPGRIRLVGIDPLTKKDIEVVVTEDNDEMPHFSTDPILATEEDAFAEGAEDAATELVIPLEHSNLGLAEREAIAMMRELKLTALKLSVKIFGDPWIRPNMNGIVAGLDQLLDGIYHVLSVKHTLGPGYSADVMIGRDGFKKRKGSRRRIKEPTAAYDTLTRVLASGINALSRAGNLILPQPGLSSRRRR